VPSESESLLSRWKRLAHRVGAFQARLLFALLYLTVVAPFAFIARWTADSFRSSAWIPHHETEESVRDAVRRQF
jgi:hypothetical protein